MRSTLLFAALALALGTAEAAETQRYVVLAPEATIGHLHATIDGDTVSVDYDVKDNGRGPTMKETLRLSEAGLPIDWSISGATTFGSKVDERFSLVDGKATWKDAVGAGESSAAAGALYIGQSGTPWALGVYARALMADADGRIATLPGGELRLEKGDTLELGSGDAKQTVQRVTLSGLDLDPTHLLLEADGDLFAVLSGGRSLVIREGFEADAERLRQLAIELGEQRFVAMQAEVAHRYAHPVRIRNVRVFDPKTGTRSEPVSVVVYRNRISGIQPLDATGTGPEVIVEGEGGTLVPGMYEMHGHIGQNRTVLNLAAGITSVRDMGNDNDVLDRLIQNIESGKLAGPRITRAGFIEGRSPFNSNNGYLVSSQAQALEAVRWYAARGFPQIKLYNSMNPAWSAAAAAEAHRLGLRVSGHIPAFTNADAMIEAGYDELTHINQVMLGWVLTPEEDTRTLLRLTALKRLDALDMQSPRVRKTMDAIVAKKVAVEPTLAIHENLLLNQDGQVPSGQAEWIANLPIGAQRNAKRAWSDMSAPGDREAYAGAYQKILDGVREMHQRGVFLIPGTDLGGGLAFHRELQLFEQVGFTPAQALRRATIDMAEYLGEDQQLGSIERGKLADFFLVPGDPTASLSELKNARMVMKDGVVYFPSELYPRFGIQPFSTAPAVQVPQATTTPVSAAPPR
jgi:imidazolonepropionase-like amidohydrolase